jgi:hypothetical protein
MHNAQIEAIKHIKREKRDVLCSEFEYSQQTLQNDGIEVNNVSDFERAIDKIDFDRYMNMAFANGFARCADIIIQHLKKPDSTYPETRIDIPGGYITKKTVELVDVYCEEIERFIQNMADFTPMDFGGNDAIMHIETLEDILSKPEEYEEIDKSLLYQLQELHRKIKDGALFIRV